MSMLASDLARKVDVFRVEHNKTPRAIIVTRTDFDSLVAWSHPDIVLTDSQERHATLFGIPLKVSDLAMPGRAIIDYGIG